VSNQVKVKGEQVPTVPENRNVFECVGDALTQSNVIIGALLKFSKGDWLAGPDAEEMAAGTELVAVVPGTVHGWVLWQNNKRADQVMGLLIEGFVPPARSTLGHDDQSKWEVDATGRPRDPWQPTIYMPIISLDATTVSRSRPARTAADATPSVRCARNTAATSASIRTSCRS